MFLLKPRRSRKKRLLSHFRSLGFLSKLFCVSFALENQAEDVFGCKCINVLFHIKSFKK